MKNKFRKIINLILRRIIQEIEEFNFKEKFLFLKIFLSLKRVRMRRFVCGLCASCRKDK